MLLSDQRTSDHGARRRRFAPRPFAPRRAELDTVIVGGGPAGLSAALVLGRARRSVLVVDEGRPANAASTHAIGGLLAQTGVAPAELRREGREQLAGYESVDLRADAVLDVDRGPDSFAVSLAEGGSVRARSIVLAHGLRYEPPPLPGIKGLWGSSVFHCPFCDGWEVRDLPLAFHGNGPDAARSALFLSNWSRDVVLCTDGPAQLDGERVALEAAGVRVREEPIRTLVGRDGALERIDFLTGPPEHRDALFVRTRRDQPNGLAEALGCRLSESETVVADADGRTGVEGVYAAGDTATEHFRSVANAMGAGSRVAYAATLDLAAAPVPVDR